MATLLKIDLPIFQVFDLEGNPVSDGKIYIGTTGLNPEITANQISIFWDKAGAIPAVQPISTIAGYPARSGKIASLFVNASSYSMTIRDKNKNLIYSILDATSLVDTASINYLFPDANAVTRTLGARLADLVFITDFGVEMDGVTDYSTEVQNAIDYCVANGADPYWPEGSVVTTSSIDNLHDVRHFGPGAIKRGSDTFYLYPSAGQSNILYVATTGDDTNDGLSSSEPLATHQQAFDNLTNYGPTLNGNWKVQAAAGTYDFSAGQQTLQNLKSVNRVVVAGPDVAVTVGTVRIYLKTVSGALSVGDVLTGAISGNATVTSYSDRLVEATMNSGSFVAGDTVSGSLSGNTGVVVMVQAKPTCIIDGGSTATNYLHGLSATGQGLSVTYQNMMAINFDNDPGGSTRGAFLGDSGVDLYTDNIHATGATWFGIYASRQTQIRIKGGMLIGCRNNFVSDMAKISLGYNSTDLSTGTLIKDATQVGAYWVRESDGHIDYCVMDNNAVGVISAYYSRIDGVGNDFKRNTVGYREEGGSYLDNTSTPAEFNIGTADANTKVMERRAALDFKGVDCDLSYRIMSDRSTRSASGITADTFTSIGTILAGRLQGANKSAVYRADGIYKCTAGSQLIVTIGGISLTLGVIGSPSNVVFFLEVHLHEIAGGYRAFGILQHNNAAPRMGSATGFVSTSDQAVSLGYNLLGAGDSLTVYRQDLTTIG